MHTSKCPQTLKDKEAKVIQKEQKQQNPPQNYSMQ